MNIILGIFIFILGSCFASFFGVIISRVPLNKSIVKPDSYCFNCGHSLRWYENIPIISYILLGGKCSKCKTNIGIEGFIYEILGGLVPLIIFIFKGINVESILLMIISLVLLLLAGYDYATHTILDVMWIILGALIVILTVYRFIFVKDFNIVFLNLISFGIGSILFVLIKIIGYVFVKQDILGTGDIIVFGLSCLLYNPFGILIALLCSCVPGSIIEIVRLSKNPDHELAFLPYLNIGIYCAILFSDYVLNIISEVI